MVGGGAPASSVCDVRDLQVAVCLADRRRPKVTADERLPTG